MQKISILSCETDFQFISDTKWGSFASKIHVLIVVSCEQLYKT